MNIKINIKDCDCEPTVITKKEYSEVEFKKKNMLYAPPTKDPKSNKSSQKRPTSTLNIESRKNDPSKYVPSADDERRFLNEMSQISKNQMTTDYVHHNNTVLQRQNQILQENQRTLHHLVTNPQNASMSRQDDSQRNAELKRAFEQAADKIAREVKEIKKVRDQIVEYGQNIKKGMNHGRPSILSQQAPQQIGEMNSNLKNLVELSKNHIDGLQNLEGIKSLQNFNMEAYTQSINTLKKQIVQYQKESETIERQLKLRVAKLQKLEITPNFEEELLQPYEEHLKKKVEGIDLHAIKDKVYEKLGVFDYGKFQNDVCAITNDIKNDMNEFYIICKQYRIDIPDIKIDKKELKQLDLNLPSVLDDFKASRGIVFENKPAQGDKKSTELKKGMTGQQFMAQNQTQNKEKPTQPKVNPPAKNSLRNEDLGELYTKPVDLSKNTKLTRTDQQKPRTVLETSQEQQRKQMSRNIKKSVVNQDDEFEKYLESRAKEQLAAIYEERKKKLDQMQKELYKKCKQEPEYELTMNVKNKIQPKKSPPKKQMRREEEVDEYGEDFEDQEEEKPRREEQKEKRPAQTKETEEIKNIGTEVLREKLKNLFSKNPNLNENVHQNRLLQPEGNPVQANQMNSIAEGFINMINNTLTQVNTQLSQSIQKKMTNRTLSNERRPEFDRKSPNRIVVPKLEQFRAPPVFNMQMVYEPSHKQEEKRVEKKIVPKDYNYLRIQEENNELEISSISNDQ